MRISDWSSDVCSSDLVSRQQESGRQEVLDTLTVQRSEPDPRLPGLPFRPLVAVDAQLRVVREVGAELQEERPEVRVHGVDVEVVHQPGGLHDPRVRDALGVAAFLGAEQVRLLLRPPEEQHALVSAVGFELRSEEQKSEIQSLIRKSYV